MDWLLNLDFAVLAKIIAIDLVMGVDNAIVIAMAVAALAAHQQKTAIFLGTAGAILARILFLFIGFWLVALPLVKLIAGAYLVYLGFKLVNTSEGEENVNASTSLFGAAATIVVADIALSLDNVVALVGAAEGTGDHAFGYTVFGILLSIPVIVLASKFLITMIEKFPVLLWCGGALITWVGAEMILKDQYFLQGLTSYLSISLNHTVELIVAGVITAVTMLIAYVVKDNVVDMVPNK